MSPQSPQLQSVDFTNTPLSIEQPVAFIEDDNDHRGESRLYGGKIKLIGDGQLVVQSGSRLFIVNGREVSHPKSFRFWSVIGLSSESETAH
jgi:hypothetical protein